MPAQMAGVARREENPVEHGFRIHCALVPGEDLSRTVTAIIAFFVYPLSLHIVVVHEGAKNGKHLFPGARLGELRVRHFSG